MPTGIHASQLKKSAFTVLLPDDPFNPLTPTCLGFSSFRKKAPVDRPSPFLPCIFAALPARLPGSVQFLTTAAQKWRWQSRVKIKNRANKTHKFHLCFSIQIGNFLVPVVWLSPGFLAGGRFWQGIKGAFKPELNQDLPWAKAVFLVLGSQWGVPKS